MDVPHETWLPSMLVVVGVVFASLLAILARLLRKSGAINAALQQEVVERRRTESALRSSEAHLRALLDTIPDPVWLKDPSGVYLHCNRRFEDLYGASETEILGRTDYDFADREQADFFRKHDRLALLASRPSRNEEEVVFARDGHREILETIKTPVVGREGTVIGVLGIGRDISARKRIELELKQSRADLSALLETMTGLIWSVDATMRLRSFNGRFGEHYRSVHGTDPKVGSILLDPLPAPDAPTWEALLARVAEEGRLASERSLADGRIMSLFLQTIPGDEGPAGISIVAKDITERRATEAALRASEAEYRGLFEFMSSGFVLLEVLLDQEGNPVDHRLLQANSEFETMTGLRREEQVGRTSRDLGFQWPPEVAASYYTIAMTGGWLIYDRYNESLQRHYEIRAFSPSRGKFALLFHDITDRKRSEEELEAMRSNLECLVEERTRELASSRKEAMDALEEANRMRDRSQRALADLQEKEVALVAARDSAEAANRAKSSFLANMSHELRTPLNAILGFAQILARDPEARPDQKEKFGIVLKAGEHLLSIINDILDLAKIEAGKLSVEKTDFDLGALTRDLMALLRVRAEAKGLDLMLDQDSSFPRFVRTDSSKLRQVVINLVGNAIKFTREGSVTIKLSVEDASESADGLRLLFEIADTGIGMSEADLERIFDPFVQLQQREGTGLGLTITRQFVALLGGEISVESKLGKGSIFRFTAGFEPVDPARIRDLAAPSGSVVGIRHAGMYRILVVEDHPDNRLLLRNLLEPFGFQLREAKDGREGVEAFREWSPHLVLMDRRMPVLDGLEATKAIRRMPGGRSAIVVAVTAHAFEEERTEMLRAGCDDFLAKPFAEGEFFEILKRHLSLEVVRDEPQSAPASAVSTPSQADLANLPPPERAALRDALLRSDMTAIRDGIARIASSAPRIAAGLGACADAFQYALLARLLEDAEELVSRGGHGQGSGESP